MGLWLFDGHGGGRATSERRPASQRGRWWPPPHGSAWADPGSGLVRFAVARRCVNVGVRLGAAFAEEAGGIMIPRGEVPELASPLFIKGGRRLAARRRPTPVAADVDVAVHRMQTSNIAYQPEVRIPSSLAHRQPTPNRPPEPSMAPSRAAVSRIAANAAFSTRRCASAARLPIPLTPSSANSFFSPRIPARASVSVSHYRQCPAAACRAMSTAAAAPEPPDYLSEGELHVFNKIKDNLDPVRLEV